MITTRPKTLAEVGRYVLEGNAMGHELADFLDEFYERPNDEAFAEEPPILASRVERGQKHDAFLAATAEYLSMKYGFSPPIGPSIRRGRWTIRFSISNPARDASFY